MTGRIQLVGIANVSTLDLVPSIRPTRIEAPPDAGANETVRADIDGWVFPRSGVAFVWALEGEVESRAAGDRKRATHSSTPGSATARERG